MAGQISFRYFRSVEGKAVPRYGTGGQTRADALIGAERVNTTKAERQSGKPSIVWHTDKVVSLPVSWCQRYAKELGGHLKRGELIEVSDVDNNALLAVDTEPAPAPELPAAEDLKEPE